MQEKGTISIHTENIFPIIKKFLYSDHEIFLRELISNAVDATQKIKRLSSLGEYADDLGDLTIDVKVDKKKKTITVIDRGIGMTAEEIKKYINQIAFSGATEFVEKFKDAADAKEIIGKFGLGFYSSFMVAKKVDIITKSYQKDAEAAKWECEGETDFEISKAKKTERGTEIVLHIADDSEEFLEESRIQGILDKYCKFLPVEIRFGDKEKSVEDGKDKDGNPKYKTEKVDNIINNTSPIWTKSPTELKDEDYLAFYKELHPFSEDPLFWIHLNVDYPFNLTGVLYFPKVSNNIELDRNKILLFSRQVFITDEVRDIVPEYLRLLHGVIDSPDIPLNVSRSYLQSDSNVKKINNYITKKVADKLGEIFKNDRKAFESKFDNIDVFIKYGMISDEKFYEKAKDFALVKDIDDKYHTFDEYRSKIEGSQKDKNDMVVWLYASDLDKQHTYIESAKRKGYDVIQLGGPLDNHFINHIEMKLDKTAIKRVDSDIIDKLIEKDEKLDHVLTEDEQNKVKDIFTKVVPNKNYSVTVESLPEDELPVSITMAEYIRRMKDMQAMGGGGGMAFMGNMPDSYAVQVNGNHKLIQKILKAKTEKTQKSYAKQAMDLALLSQGLLGGKDLSEFVKRSVEIASK
ncbi:MAG: molecular chaperone HtpG [Cytophagales bacterium]